MKRLSKKALSIVLAAIMVLTSIPMFAINLSAADSLDIAVQKFEGYVNDIATSGVSALRTNMADAYSVYLEALDMTESSTEERNAKAHELNDVLRNCQLYSTPTTLTDMTINNLSIESDYFKNVLYSDSANATMNDAAMVEKTSGGGIIWTYGGNLYTYFPNTVILYDGVTVPRIPIIFAAQQHSNNTTYWIAALSASSNYLGIHQNWKGFEVNSSLTWPNVSDKEVVTNNDDMTSSNRYKITESTSTYDIYKNYLTYNPSNAPTGGYFIIPSVSVNATLYYNNIISSNDEYVYSEINNTNSKIYVVNRKILTDALDESLSTYQDYFSNEQYLKDGSLYALFDAYDKAVAIDVSGADYSVNTESTVTQIGTQIENAIASVKAAKPSSSAARADQLDKVIEEYEEKMNSGKVYSNMLDAYKYYMVSKELADAYKYANKESDKWDEALMSKALDTAAENLKIKTNAMHEREGAYNFYPDAGFAEDTASEEKCDDYKASYKNLVWAGQAPSRERTDNAKCPSNILKLNLSNSSSYLYIGNAVGVYDGTGEANEITVPAILGFTAEGTDVINHDRALYTYYSCDSMAPEDRFVKYTTGLFGGEKHYQDPTTNGLDFATDWQTGGTSDSPIYTSTFSLNKILNNDVHTAAIAHTKNQTGLQSGARNNHGTDRDDPEHYYANIVKVNTQNMSDTSKTVFEDRSGVQKYWYKYDKITCIHRAYAIGYGSDDPLTNPDAGDIASYNDSSNGKYANDGLGANSNKNGKDSTNTLDTLSIYVINYKPVRDIINNNDALLKGETSIGTFRIQDFVEGGLLDYFYDMDRLTEVDPSNPKYQYTSSTGVDQHESVSIQCATDIYNLLEGSEHVTIDDTTDPTTITKPNGDPYIAADTLNASGEDAYYTNLKEELDNTVSEQGCYTDSVWNAYTQAVNEGRDAMLNVASSIAMTIGEDDITYNINGYVDTYNGSPISDYVDDIIDAKAQLTDANSAHVYRYFSREESDNETGIFKCSKTFTHNTGYADMSVYDTMAIVYSTIDRTKFTSDGKGHLDRGKSLFDEVLATDMSAMSVSGMTLMDKRKAAIEAILDENDPNRPEPAQALVDNGIAELLTEITEANEDANVESYSVKLNVYKVEDGTKTVVAQNVDVTPADGYGTVSNIDASAYTEGQNVSSWQIINGNIDQTFTVEGTTLPVYIQGGTTTINAYYTPAKTTEKIALKVSSVLKLPLYSMNVSKATTVALKNGDINTLVIGGTEYPVSNISSHKVIGWKVNGQTVDTIDATAETLADEGDTINIEPVVEIVINDKYNITLDGNVLVQDASYDYHYRNLAKAEGSDFLAVIESGTFKPVTYGDSYEFYANGLLHDFYSVKKVGDDYYVGNTKINYSDTQLFFLNNKLPTVSSLAEKVSNTNYTVRSQFTMGSNATLTEWGTLYTLSHIEDEDFNIEAVDDSSLNVYKAVGTKKVDESNQFAQPFVLSTPVPIYTRTYLKFRYTYDGKQYDAITYSDINVCFNNA
ncbi:MAG: hypothetical protein IJT65_07195 [Eubacterium sp.]|nr:hypothetical protein [Eubacterium sp.]